MKQRLQRKRDVLYYFIIYVWMILISIGPISFIKMFQNQGAILSPLLLTWFNFNPSMDM